MYQNWQSDTSKYTCRQDSETYNSLHYFGTKSGTMRIEAKHACNKLNLRIDRYNEFSILR